MKCRLPICDECTVTLGGKTLCPEDARVDNAGDEEDRIDHLAVADPSKVLHAGFASRVVAGAIDGVLLLISAVLLAAAYWLLTGVPPLALRVFRYRPLEFTSYWGLLFLITVSYSVIFTVIDGQTPGKQATKIAVVEEDGTTPTIQTALVRFGASILSLVPLGAGYFAILRDPQKRAWHDRISNTYVISLDEATERL